MKRFEYKILDAAVIEPHKESEEFDLRYEEACDGLLRYCFERRYFFLMSSFTAEQLAQCVVDLKLVGQDEMQALQSQFNIASLSSEELMQVLVRREMLTNYQAARVMRGEKDGYFYGTYKILYLISQGTFARVYRAVDQTTGQGVALKILRKQFTISLVSMLIKNLLLLDLAQWKSLTAVM